MNRSMGRRGVLMSQQIAESGLPLHAFDDFEEAAKKCLALTKNP